MIRQEHWDIVNKVITSDFFVVGLQLLFFFAVIKTANFLIERFALRIIKFNSDSEFIKQVNTTKHIVESVVDTIIGIFGVIYILNRLGIDIRPILTAAGILGVAVGFGAKRFVEDVITGLVLIFEGQIRVGDVVEIAGKVGTVEKVDIKLVILRDMSGNVHYIRNGMIDIVTNMTRDYSYYVFDISIAYKENIDKVLKILTDLDKDFRANCEFKEDIIAPLEILGVDELAESSVIIKARYRTRPRNQWQVGRAFKKTYKNKFDELGIEIPFPQRRLHTSE